MQEEMSDGVSKWSSMLRRMGGIAKMFLVEEEVSSMCNSLAQSSLGPWFDPECGDISFCLFAHFFFVFLHIVFLFTKSFSWMTP